MDDKDKMILELLKLNGKLTTSQISKKLKLPITTVHNRIKRMEYSGIIEGYGIRLNYEKLGKPIKAVILANVNYALPDGKKVSQESVAKKVKNMGAEAVSIVTGGTDLVIVYRSKGVEELNKFIINKLREVDGIDKTQTMIVLEDF